MLDIKYFAGEWKLSMRDFKRLLRRVAVVIKDEWQLWFRKLNQRKSVYGHYFYIKEGVYKTFVDKSFKMVGDSLVVPVSNRSNKMHHKFTGGTVVPKNARFLAIPISQKAKAAKARPKIVLRSLKTYIFRKNGRSFLADVKRRYVYLLKSSVKHKPHEYVKADCKENAPKLNAAVRREVKRFEMEMSAKVSSRLKRIGK